MGAAIVLALIWPLAGGAQELAAETQGRIDFDSFTPKTMFDLARERRDQWATQRVWGDLSLPKGDAAKLADNWAPWIWAMLPVAVIGLVMCARIWNARPKSGGGH